MVLVRRNKRRFEKGITLRKGFESAKFFQKALFQFHGSFFIDLGEEANVLAQHLLGAVRNNYGVFHASSSARISRR